MMKLNRLSVAILLPYKSASQSGIVLTSFMYGKPVIATKVGALVETVCNEINGLLVEPGDAEGFAFAMLRLVKDIALLKKLQRGAFRFGISDQFDWNRIAEKTIEFYFK
ncbi:MAG: glycosyltransferase [Bacteroides sp.]|nr:glycosyltransferase [Bacteroides sp.]